MTTDPKKAQRIHRLDQSGALLRDIARLLATYKKHLQTEGFPPDEAFQLLLVYEKRIMGDPTLECPNCGEVFTLDP